MDELTPQIVLMERRVDYKNEVAVRVEIVDRLLRARKDGKPYGEKEGASYRDMVEMLDRLDKRTKRDLGVADGLLSDETLYQAARFKMQKTLETICDAYAAARGLLPDRKESGKTRITIRRKLLVEIPRRKETGCKLFRYRDPNYSVIESGDYEQYLSGEKSPVFVKVYPSATDSLALLKKARTILRETEERILKQFVRIRVLGNQQIFYKEKSNWEKESMKNLEEAIQATTKNPYPSARMETAKLFYSYAALLILIGDKEKAKAQLEEVLRLCKDTMTKESNALFVLAKQLLEQLNDSREVVLSVYSTSFGLWHLPLPQTKYQRISAMHRQQQAIIPDLGGSKSPYMVIQILHPTRFSTKRPYGLPSSIPVAQVHHPLLSRHQKFMIKGAAKKFGKQVSQKSMLLMVERADNAVVRRDIF